MYFQIVRVYYISYLLEWDRYLYNLKIYTLYTITERITNLQSYSNPIGY